MNAFRQALVILAVALIPSALTAAFHPRRPAWVQARQGEVSLATVREWGASVLWVDARPQADYLAQHVPGAIALSLEDWEVDLPRFLDQWDAKRKVIVYCSSTACELSHEVGERLKQNGITSVFVLQGGWDTLREGGIVQ